MNWMDEWKNKIPVYKCNTLIIGTGCAGYNAADNLYDLGCQDIIIVTEGMKMGTSRNTGSDKQTYYKLAVQSGEEDNVEKMARTLFSGKSVNGDTAFAEAVNSIRCFMKLVHLGVPFPTNQYGEFVGYQTDHTTEKRATSAGPLTSKYMTEALEKQVWQKKIPIIDHTMIVELIRDEDGILGAIGINKRESNEKYMGFTLFLADNVVMATGGPAAIYQNRVYPPSQTGMTGMAIETGARCANLQEWQYGIASVDFRWNLSGTYQQVIPRYISIGPDGQEHEFLHEYFNNPADAVNYVFMKGYQWPFDSARLNGSTVIDMIVYNEEINRKRKVYLDFRTEPCELKKGLDCLSEEAYQYLKNSDALIPLPIKRLEKMNQAAIELYKSHGIDLYREPLRITVAAQHNNGGVAVDANWETNVKGLYAIGEAAGTFGVYRPGGSALNACQVGALRAAEHIRWSKRKRDKSAEQTVNKSVLCKKVWSLIGEETGSKDDPDKESKETCQDTSGKSSILAAPIEHARIKEIRGEAAYGMSAYGAQIRNVQQLEKLKENTGQFLEELDQMIPKLNNIDFPLWFKVRDMLITQRAVIGSMIYSAKYIGSRGGSITSEMELDFSSAEAIMKTPAENHTEYDDQVLVFENEVGCSFEKVRPIPKTERWFEKVWNEYNDREKF